MNTNDTEIVFRSQGEQQHESLFQEAQEESPEQILREGAQALRDMADRGTYAVVAAAVTYAVATQIFGTESHDASDVVILNAGVAYYTHAASGRIVKAIYCVAEPHVKRIIRR